MFNPLARKRGPSVTDQIKDFILSNNLRPGDIMPTEAAISAELDVSRSSVREAMRTLAALDIVEIRHGYGTYVGEISLAPLVEGLVFRGVMSPENNFSALREVVEIREVLDLAMADQVVNSLVGATDPELHDLVAMMEDLAARKESFAEADNAFHQRILSRLDNQLVGQLSTAFWEVHTVVYPLLGLPPAHDISETAHAHGLMLNAAENGDITAYKEAVILHYQPLRRSIDKALASPDA
ncbi:FadR family transcriptional regulator [Paramicrobacterium chengjingii]|uniref:FadR family transcriptional regulator n=2 Tax=Paramicrobacterium chengjingii TaxID=2769067 RepID=A0ABX6YNK9_9MICO|nr:FadR family transcriptional regulator [Microbacterium chengjingii]